MKPTKPETITEIFIREGYARWRSVREIAKHIKISEGSIWTLLGRLSNDGIDSLHVRTAKKALRGVGATLFIRTEDGVMHEVDMSR